MGEIHLRLRLRLLDEQLAQAGAAFSAALNREGEAIASDQCDHLTSDVRLFDAVLFNSTREQRAVLVPANCVQVVFKMAVNSYGGCDRLQLMILEVRIDG